MINALRQARRLALLSALAALAASSALVSPDVAPAALAALSRLHDQAEEAERVTVRVGESRDLAHASAVSASAVSDPEILTAAVAGARTVRLTGLARGSALLIVTTAAGRKVYSVEVAPPLSALRPRPARAPRLSAPRAEGVYALALSRPAAGGALTLAHALDFRQPLGHGRALFASAVILNGSGGAAAPGPGGQRIALALETDRGRLDALDYELSGGLVRGGGGLLRGARYRAAQGSSWDGLDLFAGSSAASGGGYHYGAFIPVSRTSSFLLRAGALRGDTPDGAPSKLSAAADLQYSPDERTTFTAEVFGPPGRLAWGARLDLRRDAFDVAAEARQHWRGSAERTYSFGATWKPAASLRASARWHHSAAVAGRGPASTISASLGYAPAGHSAIALSLTRVRSPAWGGSQNAPSFAESAYASARYQFNLNRWSNSLEYLRGRTSPLSPGAPASGLTQVANYFRRQFGGWALGASYKYQLREEPARAVGEQDAGANLRAAFSRYRLDAGAYYRVLASGGDRSRGFRAAASLGYRLDRATDIRVSYAQTFAPGSGSGAPGFTFSVSRRFAGGGLNPLRLFRRDSVRLAGFVFFDHNGNGARDAGEPGASNMVVKLGGGARALTDAAGGFSFNAAGGEHTVELLSERLGVSLLATSATSRRLLLDSGTPHVIAFGVTDAATLGGRVYNDVGRVPDDAPGIAGVRLRLTGAGHVSESVTNASGLYSFQNLRPGPYSVEIVADSLPADFRLPAQLAWPVGLDPLEREGLSVGLVAHRAITGKVFADRDGDGDYKPGVDVPLDGVLVEFAGRAARTGAGGSYILRGLPAGAGTLTAARGGAVLFTMPLTLGAEPVTATAHIPLP